MYLSRCLCLELVKGCICQPLTQLQLELQSFRAPCAAGPKQYRHERMRSGDYIIFRSSLGLPGFRPLLPQLKSALFFTPPKVLMLPWDIKRPGELLSVRRVLTDWTSSSKLLVFFEQGRNDPSGKAYVKSKKCISQNQALSQVLQPPGNVFWSAMAVWWWT